jgi:NAD(P)-dependent dehydrogenase (short-subunit alcohol dehydrogenase family)
VSATSGAGGGPNHPAGFLPVDMTGVRVLVTAGAAGIGRCIAAAFRGRGARVRICDVSTEALDEARRLMPDVPGDRVDVADPAAVAAMFDDVRRNFGGLDVLVNNAGIAGPTARVEDIAPGDLDRTLDVNVSSQFHCARHAVPMLKAAGGGSIINLSSVAGRLGFTMRSPYAASKWAVVGFTKSLAVELGADNIRVNAILPGHVETDRFRRVVEAKAKALGLAPAEMRRQYLDVVSLKRTVTMDDVANMALYLASPFGASVTGQAISVCGDVQMMR